MTKRQPQQPPSDPSRAVTQTKRKHHSHTEQQSHSHKKRRRLVSKTKTKIETLTLIPDPSTSNQFAHLNSSSQTRRKRSHRKPSGSGSEGTNSTRKWVFSSRDFSSYKDKVVVVSYNILGVDNASKHPDLYHKVPPKYLEWDRRKILIHEEITLYSASILCFQEVDRFDDLDDLFQKDGFRGVYKARTGEACDGCAVFWKDELFTLLHQENIEFKSFGLRDNVAQLCVLEMNQNLTQSELYAKASMIPPTRSRRLLIGNIHVLFNPNRGDIKLGQVRLFLEKAYKLSQKWGSIPVIIGGDLNSIPQSAIYQFLASSELDVQLHDRRKISGQIEHSSQGRGFKFQNENVARYGGSISIPRPLLYRWNDEELRLATGSGGVTHVQHQLKLCSAYLGVPGSCRTRDNYGEPLATSYHSKFIGTVDYIWHTEELVPVRVLETLAIDILRKSGGLPSKKWGSDHLALVCELAFADDGKGT